MAYNIKAAIRAAKNMQYEPIEVKVREATNNDAWGVSTSAMADIARATHHHDEYSLLFKMVWKRLTDVEHVMHVQKSLILVDYLLRNGAERFINDAKRRARDISALQKYKQYDANNRDVGGDVRAKAKNVYELLTNDAKLAEERGKAQAIRDVKLSGIGNDGYGPGDAHGGGGGGGDRESHRDRFTEREGGESPRENDWEKENDVQDYDPDRKHREAAADEAAADEKRREEKKKKKKEKKAAEAAAEAAVDEEPPAEDGEKKKKKKKKKSVADASEASADDSSFAATATAASTAPSSGITSTVSTPAFTASSATLDSFDAFAPSQNSNGAAFGAPAAFAAQPAAAPAAAQPAAASALGEADKPKKSRKSKKNSLVDTEAAAAPAAAAPPAVSVGGDYDLVGNFSAIPTPRGPGSSDLDILTGTNAPVGRLEDMFSSATLMDEPLDNGGEEDDGFAVEEEPALLDMIQSSAAAGGSVVSPRHSGGGGVGASSEPKKAADVWDLAADFTNIDNLKGTVAKKKAGVREEVSMSMMRGMQPFGGSGGSSLAQATAAPAPAAAASPFFGGGGAGANAFGGLPGMGGAQFGGGMGGMGGMGMAAPSPFGGMPGAHSGFGMAPHAAAGGMPGMAGGMAGFGGMPGGMPGGMQGGMPGGMGGFGAMGGAAPSAPIGSDLPFAALPNAASRGKSSANGKPIVFDAIPAARQAGQAAPIATGGHGPAGPNWNR